MRRAGLLAVVLVAGCTDPREAELAQELVTLQDARTSRLAVEKLVEENAASDAALLELQERIEGLRAAVGETEAMARAAEAAYQREIERNGALNLAIQEGQQRLTEAVAREAALGQEIEIARVRARTFKDQAAVLVKEMRPDDPDWAQELRIRSLKEFLDMVGKTWPRDPVLAEVAKAELPADPREATRIGAERAAQVRDRVSEVYGLADETGTAGAPAVAAEPPDAS
jgi:hypothetical protein